MCQFVGGYLCDARWLLLLFDENKRLRVEERGVKKLGLGCFLSGLDLQPTELLVQCGLIRLVLGVEFVASLQHVGYSWILVDVSAGKDRVFFLNDCGMKGTCVGLPAASLIGLLAARSVKVIGSAKQW